MTTTRRTARLARVSALAATGALAHGLLPLASAQAGILAPVVSFIGAGPTSLTSAVGAMDGTGTSPLTAPGYQTFGLDVSADGNTALLALCHGTYNVAPTAAAPSQCTDGPKGTAYDATFGLVLVHRDSTGGVVRARVLATQWDGNAVLTTNGSATSAWFLLDGDLYRYDITETAGVWNPSATGTGNDVTVADSTHFAPLATATSAAIGLAVSSDGTEAATMWRSASDYKNGQVRVATIGASGAVMWNRTFSGAVGHTQPSPSSFAFDGTSALAFTTQTYTTTGGVAPGTLATQVVDLAEATPSAVENSSLAGFYGLRTDDASRWWAWKDAGSTSGLYTVTTPITKDSLPSGTAVATRSDGATTFGFVESLSGVTPPSLAEVTDLANPALAVRPAAHLSMVFSTSSVAPRTRVPYATYNYYWADLPGKPYSVAVAAENDHGSLYYSYDGVNWSPRIATSGATAFPVGTKYYNGRTPALTRNTFFKWVYSGDALTTGATTGVRVISVKPAVTTLKVSTLSGKRRVYGVIQQNAGRIALYRLVGSTWTTVSVTTINSAGGFTFGYRSLAHGSYQVRTVGGTAIGSGWATAALRFSL